MSHDPLIILCVCFSLQENEEVLSLQEDSRDHRKNLIPEWIIHCHLALIIMFMNDTSWPLPLLSSHIHGSPYTVRMM